MAEQDYRVGQIIDAVEQAGMGDNTLIVFSSDNGALDTNTPNMWGGCTGPWRGSFFSQPWEGCTRTGAMVRWPGRVPSGVVTDQLISCHDWYKTFAALAGASDKVPTDRPLDGVDASQLLLGKSQTTGRESLLFFGSDGKIMSSKWRNLKLVVRYCDGIDTPIVEPMFPMLFDLENDPQERYNLSTYRFDGMWMAFLLLQASLEWEKSVAQYPNIEPTRAAVRTSTRSDPVTRTSVKVPPGQLQGDGSPLVLRSSRGSSQEGGASWLRRAGCGTARGPRLPR
jgi:Sulfatase